MQSGQLSSDNHPNSISNNDSEINEIMIAGDKYLTSGDQLNAQKKYGEILATLSENKQVDSLIAGRTHKKMGDSFRDLGDQVKAKEYYLIALEILKKHESNLEVTFDMLTIQGNISHVSHDLPNAKDLYEKALAILDKVPTDKNQDKARTLRKIGDVNRDLGSYDDAILCYQRDFFFSKDELEIASTFRKLGYIYQCKNDLAQAKNYYEQALNIKRKHGVNNRMTLVNILNCLGSLYVNLNEIDMAISVLKESIDIIRDKEHLADSNNRYLEFALTWLAKAENIHSSKSLPETKQIQHEVVTQKTISRISLPVSLSSSRSIIWAEQNETKEMNAASYSKLTPE